MAAPALTPAERAFIERMAPHVAAGKSLEEAARAVLADDTRLWLAATAKDDVGQAIRDDMAARVYFKLRA